MLEWRGNHFCSKGVIWAAVSAGVLLRNEHASSSASTGKCQSESSCLEEDQIGRTPESINSPLLELFKRDVSRRGNLVEI